MQKPIRQATALAAILFSTYGGSAAAYMINDTYHGGDAHGYGDRIGDPVFEVQGADLTRSNNTLTVDVFTSFAGRADEKLFAAYTNKAASKINGVSQGIGYGDLFLSTGWSPFGTAPYLQDNNVTGTQWLYGFSIDGNRWTDAGGTGTLYLLSGATNNADTLLSEDFMSGAIYRNGQEIAVDRSSSTAIAVGTGTWSVDAANSKLSFSFGVGNTLLANAGTIALHWAMSCGNDTLEGAHQFPLPPNVGVPEPASLMLTLLGLAGVGGGRRWFRRS